MPISKLRPSFTFDQDRLAQLRAIAPEAFADGKINWDVLKEALGENLEDESPNAEHFGLFWPGKREARRFASKPSSGTLIPAPGEGVDEETTHNIFIEGDNLEVLKLLQKSYAGQVKMVYIDPPYNTGNDFVYVDSFGESKSEYGQKTGDVNEVGQRLTTNTRADGRFHSNWLNMMYPRLRVAQTFLRPDGVIFVSIDDNEIGNLRTIMSEVFGEENFIATLIWKSKSGGANDSRYFAVDHEYILVYGKDASRVEFALDKEAEVTTQYNLEDEKGKYALDRLDKQSIRYSKSLDYEIVGPDGRKYYPAHKDKSRPNASWRWGKETVKERYDELVFKDGFIYTKNYKKEGAIPRSLLVDERFGRTRTGKTDLAAIFPEAPFENPKPPKLISSLIQITCQQNDLVMDFFAGAGSTAQAVFDFNQKNNQQCRFILAQIPEPTEDTKFQTITEIGKERIRRVSKKLKKEKAKGDLGFRVFKLAPSNFKQWRDYDGQDLDALETQFAQFETPLVEGWTRENLLAEILLQQGFPLDSTLAPQKEFTKNEIVAVASPASAHKLFVCLDAKIHDATIKQLKLAKRDVFICLDAALSSEAKVRLGDAANLVVI